MTPRRVAEVEQGACLAHLPTQCAWKRWWQPSVRVGRPSSRDTRQMLHSSAVEACVGALLLLLVAITEQFFDN